MRRNTALLCVLPKRHWAHSTIASACSQTCTSLTLLSETTAPCATPPKWRTPLHRLILNANVTNFKKGALRTNAVCFLRNDGHMRSKHGAQLNKATTAITVLNESDMGGKAANMHVDVPVCKLSYSLHLRQQPVRG